jgi:hypothetical protein
MTLTLRVLLLLVLFLSGSRSVAARDSVRVSVEGDSLVIENSLVRRVLAFGTEEDPGAILPVSFTYLPTNREALSRSGQAPWFEFSINDGIVTNLEESWGYRSHSVNEMGHGGTEVAVVFEKLSGPAAGLRLQYTVQAYPTSPVIRERLQLDASREAGLTLTARDDSAGYVFPRYTFVHPSGELEGREIRIASWAYDLIESPETQPSYDERSVESGYRTGANLSQNYMNHPRFIDVAPSPGDASHHKGPILMYRPASEPFGWWIAYEHGSPDHDPEQQFVRLEQSPDAGTVTTGVHVFRGAYFDGEPITTDRPFTTLWAEAAIYEGTSFDAGEAVLWDFLYRWINDEPASREPLVYYNTWGMQRDEQLNRKDVHGVLTIDRVLEEVAHARELGIQMFVLDDGWQSNFGDWTPHPGRFPGGLGQLVQELQRNDMLFGIWMAPMHADSFATVTRQHPEWLIRGENGRPIVGRWNKHVFCLQSDYYHHFIEASKRLIDAGALHFKWDGVDTNHWCDSPNHWHGDDNQTPEERRLRYGYEMVRVINRAIAELKAYNPDVVIEFDATEPDRSIGLAILSEAKYFWMNNGASWYGDRSRYRATSMRMVPALFHRIIPPVLQNAANYPHDHPHYRAQRYAVNTSMLGGLGLWGNLSDMSPEERARAGEVVRTAIRVWDTIAGVRPTMIGSVGSTPEIYTYVEKEAAEGQVIGFTGAATVYQHVVPGLNTSNLLAVLRNAYTVQTDSLVIPFYFLSPFSSREAFLISNEGSGISVTSSTSWLRDARLVDGNTLELVNGAPGVHEVRWPQALGTPSVTGAAAQVAREPSGDYTIRIETLQPNLTVTVSGRS